MRHLFFGWFAVDCKHCRRKLLIPAAEHAKGGKRTCTRWNVEHL